MALPAQQPPPHPAAPTPAPHLHRAHHGQAAQQRAQRDAHAGPDPGVPQADAQAHEQVQCIFQGIRCHLGHRHRQARHLDQQAHVLRLLEGAGAGGRV